MQLAGAVVLTVATALAALLARHRLLARGGGCLAVSLRLPGGRWRLGLARFEPEWLLWYRTFGLRLRPGLVLGRRTLRVLDRRVPTATEALVLPPDVVVLECTNGSADVQLAVPVAALPGFLAWSESAPPRDPALRPGVVAPLG